MVVREIKTLREWLDEKVDPEIERKANCGD